ncbi:DUF421 domain-containing protein [Lentilactobacillus kribbianus]|uniref:DUF421 domain-containing protein n=1 Tax=Lentilactobacillus kribbianus TaxID=2729622 RepID=UPI001556A86D|nr:DUF421 domain-containing protein [Lentilactobacillus kribbianus]
MFNYSDIIVKLIVGFIFIVILINLTGKSNLAPSSAMDQIQNYVLGGIVGGVIYNPAITLLQFVMVLVIWSLLILIMRYLTIHVGRFKKFVTGIPITIIKNGEILVDNCLKANLAAKDIYLKLRIAGVTDIQTVKRAILETNGQLTVILQGENNTNFPVITDGTVDFDTLESMGKDLNWLRDELTKRGIDSVSQVYFAEFINDRFQLSCYPTPQIKQR